MASGIYKKGQGYWVRLMSAIFYGLIVFMGVIWLWAQLETARIGDLEPVIVQGIAATIMILVLGIIGYWLIGTRVKTVDFMIATEGEMKKVNWSTRQEITSSTIIIIGLTMLIAMLCWVFDLGFSLFFRSVGVLQ